MIDWILYLSCGFLLFQVINVLVNIAYRQLFSYPACKTMPLVSILVPARDEERNIGVLLSSLREVKYEPLEVLVLDDASSDNTASIIQSFAISDPSVKLIRSSFLPPGWLGKNHACYKLASQASGEYLLFIDADVRLAGNVVHDAVAYSSKHRLGLLSIFPVQVMKTWGERCSVPIMNYILLTLLPLLFVRVSPFRAHSAANGQFMFFEARLYREWQPHERFKEAVAEDITISRFYKKQKIKVATFAGDERVTCRMYGGYREAVNGFSKNYLLFFGNRPLFALLFVFFVSFGGIPFLLAGKWFAVYYFAALFITVAGYSIVSRQNLFLNILLFPVHLYTMWVLTFKNLTKFQQGNLTWKGRKI